MKRQIPRAFLFCALCGLAPQFASATTWLNIPASAAKAPQIWPNNCYWDYVSVGAYTALPEFCQVVFPITIPTGATIQQISVVHGNAGLNLPTPGIAAHLRVQGNAAWSDQSMKFDYSTSALLPSGTIVTTPLMGLYGVDAFPIAGNKTYQVEVDLQNGAYVTAVQVVYN